ncbi:MAG TPA: DUF309 domain-containing protein [Bacillales bacterium]|nr:DUF309 domain-containing protein [Bacillales bacterium]
MYPKAYVEFLVHFHGTRDYFECHEVLEREWKKAPRGERKAHWRGLIQIAVGMYHWRRNRTAGARKAFARAYENLRGAKEELERLAVDAKALLALLRKWEQETAREMKYRSADLPVTDRSLWAHCEKKCKEKGCTMGNPSDLTDELIVNKHEQPDRDSIVSNREKKKRGY